MVSDAQDSLLFPPDPPKSDLPSWCEHTLCDCPNVSPFLRSRVCCAVFCAKLVADLFGRGLFETYLELSCVPFLSEPMTSSRISSITNQLSVADVMAQGVTALPPVIAVTELLHILQTTPYSVRPLRSALTPALTPAQLFTAKLLCNTERACCLDSP